jgi:LmbE family N-acetylglucosaminyl deacetylase/GT2 family glycosyltransferase
VNPDFPELRSPAGLPRRVLCLAPHPDDELIACGGMLAGHADREDTVRVLVLTRAKDAVLAKQRAGECEAGLRLLGVGDVRFLDHEDGGLREALGALEEDLARELEAFGPELIYAPSPLEHHPDHLAAFEALARVAGDSDARVLLWGVGSTAGRDALFDVTPWRERKQAALAAHRSQGGAAELGEKVAARDRGAALDVDLPEVLAVEGFKELAAAELLGYGARAAALVRPDTGELPRATAVMTSFNKRDDVRENLAAIFRQGLPFEEVIVVDNASTDGTQEMIRREFPQVRLVVMPHSGYGACETFNVGFASSRTPLTAILDDDIVMPPDWLERATRRLVQEPPTTAIVSTKVVEPGMPDSHRDSPAVNTERYMSTFRGCASLARTAALREAGFYDERLFIYGNERDLTCRLLSLGYRVLQYPGTEVFHRTPFGIKPGPRSLYYHARNAWLTMLKYAPLEDLLRMPFLVLSRVVLRGRDREAAGEVTDAVGTIGIGAALRETPGAPLIVLRALGSVLWNLPYCLRNRRPVTAEDFELPLE